MTRMQMNTAQHTKIPHDKIEKETLFCTTTDGNIIALWRFRVPIEITEHTHAVVLLHGLASNRFTYDLDPDVSIANYMASNGFDTWIVELRGSGSSKFSKNQKQMNPVWNFENHVEDVRAALTEIHSKSGKSIHLIGHSMGAMLLQRAVVGVCKPLIRSGVSIAGAFCMENSRWNDFLWLWPCVQTFETIHIEFFQQTLAHLSYQFNTSWDELFFCSDNIDNNVARELFQKNWEPVCTSLLSQIRTAFTHTGLLSCPGNKTYTETLKNITTPMLCIAGSNDEQCTSADMEKAASLMPNSTFICVGKKFGQLHEYGHFDLIVGRDAKKDVWDRIIKFLVDNDHIFQPLV